MRYLLIAPAAFLTLISVNMAVADQDQGDIKPHPIGNNPNQIIWGGQPTKPPQPAAPPPAAKRVDRADYGRPVEIIGPAFPLGGYSPYVSGLSGWDPYYGYRYPYVLPPYYESTFPPVYFPWQPPNGPGANVNVIQRPVPDDDGEAAEPKKGAQRGTNAQSVALAQRYIGYGDALFAKQKYVDANQRYRTAANSAPQLADAWFRQGFTFIAQGRFDLALAAIKRGLKLNPNWAKSDFNLKELYGPDEVAKNAHREALAEAAEAKPNDADLLFLLGVHLHFDGQAQRAARFFDRAVEACRAEGPPNT